MARAEDTDYLQNFRFHAFVLDEAQKAFLQTTSPNELFTAGDGGGKAGFQSITLPDRTFEATEYREGTHKYTKKFPGPATYGESSFMRGITQRESAFYDWGTAVEGGSTYRADVIVQHFHRDDGVTESGSEGYSDEPVRTYRYHQAFCIREKMSGDLDATSGEVSISELDVAMEFYQLVLDTEPRELAGTTINAG